MERLDLSAALGAWHPLLQPLFQTSQMLYIGEVLARDRERLQPGLENVFKAFELTPPNKVKVVILGQDPYPGGEANGLAFGCGPIYSVPYSLKVIMEELNDSRTDEEGNPMLHPVAFDITLKNLAEQGVLLLNRTLTTVKGHVNYHHDIGWEIFTGTVLQHVAQTVRNCVYMAWGQYAKDTVNEFVLPYLPGNSAAILKAPHPAAQRHGYNFVGCGHFRKCNDYLIAHGKTPIQWTKD